MIHIPTVDDWWDLTRRYPEYRRPSATPLKDYGYMYILHYLDSHPTKRVLEFGHGFGADLLSRIQDTHEAWGIDNWQGLAYFPPEEEWMTLYQEKMVARCPRAKLKLGLLGTDTDLPQDYFDIVCSVSVLEEMPLKDAFAIMQHAIQLVRPGGTFINSIDLCLGPEHGGPVASYKAFSAMHREAGFDLPDENTHIDPTRVLLENPTMAMTTYQSADGENRRYRGHWATMLFVAQRP